MFYIFHNNNLEYIHYFLNDNLPYILIILNSHYMDCHVVLWTSRNDVVTAGGVAGDSPAERVAEDREAGCSEGETFPS